MYATMEFNAASGFGQSPHMGAFSFGYGATIGVLVKPTDMIQIGLAYETKSTFQDSNLTPATVRIRLNSISPQ